MSFSTSVVLSEVSGKIVYGDLLAVRGLIGYNLMQVVSPEPRIKVQPLGEVESFDEAIENFIPIVIHAGNKKVKAHINGIELSLLECGQSNYLKVQKGNKVRAFRVIDVRGTVIEAKELKVQAIVDGK